MNAARAMGPLPFVIGVVGHRDLRPEDTEALAAATGSILDEFQALMPHTPLVVLSALAEGADRLVARQALLRRIRVVAPLPMPRASYETDFSPESRQEFEDLASQADRSFALPFVDGVSVRSVSSVGRARDLQYAQVGQYIALHSHLVIALWNGVDSDRLGGTADVVKMCLTEGRMRELPSGSSWLTYEDECRPVYHVLTPRRVVSTEAITTPKLGQLVLGSDASAARRLLIYPNSAEATFRASWTSTEMFNRDAVQKRSEIDAGRKAVLVLLEQTDPIELERSAELSIVFAAADQMAPTLKRSWERAVLAVHVLVALSLLCFAAGKDSGPVIGSVGRNARPWTLGASFLLAVGAGLVWAVTSKRRIHDRFLDYRGLAEALRIQFYWNAAGLYDVEVADKYLRYQTEQLHWIRAALRACCIGRLASKSGSEAAGLRKVAKNWILDQSEYYKRAAPKRERIARQLYSWALGWLILAAYAGVVVLHDATGVLRLGEGAAVAKVLMSIGVGTAVLVAGYAGILAIEEEARQFDRMRTMFGRAAKVAARFLTESGGEPVDPYGAREVLLEIGGEALSENGDWILMHRSHPLELPLKKAELKIVMKAVKRRGKRQEG